MPRACPAHAPRMPRACPAHAPRRVRNLGLVYSDRSPGAACRTSPTVTAVEVPEHGQGGRAHRPHISRAPHGAEPRRYHSGDGSGGRDVALLEDPVGGRAVEEGAHGGQGLVHQLHGDSLRVRRRVLLTLVRSVTQVQVHMMRRVAPNTCRSADSILARRSRHVSYSVSPAPSPLASARSLPHQRASPTPQFTPIHPHPCTETCCPPPALVPSPGGGQWRLRGSSCAFVRNVFSIVARA